jgi:hypothetical protein
MRRCLADREFFGLAAAMVVVAMALLGALTWPATGGAASPPVYGMHAPTASVVDSQQQIDLTVERSPALEAARVPYSLQSGTARLGTDYSDGPSAGVATFAPGESSATITILIQHQAASTGNLTFSVRLSAPSDGGTVRAGQETTTVTIVKNGVGTLQASIKITARSGGRGPKYVALPGGRTPLYIRIVLTSTSPQPLSGTFRLELRGVRKVVRSPAVLTNLRTWQISGLAAGAASKPLDLVVTATRHFQVSVAVVSGASTLTGGASSAILEPASGNIRLASLPTVTVKTGSRSVFTGTVSAPTCTGSLVVRYKAPGPTASLDIPSFELPITAPVSGGRACRFARTKRWRPVVYDYPYFEVCIHRPGVHRCESNTRRVQFHRR